VADSAAPTEKGGVGRLLRRVAGVDEALLSEVPSDRFRYTRLGGVIVGTATIATFSMWAGLGEIAGKPAIVLVLPALLWGLFIGNLDAWIVSSLHGTRWRQHAWIVLPRVALAVVFGFLIAEPLVLLAFRPAIEHQIRDSRQTELLAFQTLLRNCNPIADSSGNSAPGCSSALVVVHRPTPAALTEQLNNLTRQEKILESAVNGDTRTLLRLEEVARLECNGSGGRGLTGRVGVGPSCQRNRNEANSFRATSHGGSQASQLIAIRRKISAVTSSLKSSQQNYQKAVNAAITEKVNERLSHQGRIGLLERLYALKQLVAKNWYLSAAEWFLRLLFVTIDCLPVITKVSGGSTPYDGLLDVRLVTIERIFDARLRTEEKRVTTQLELEQYRLERGLQAEKEKLDSELRLDTARNNLEVDAAIDEFTERLLRDQRTSAPTRRSGFYNGSPAPVGSVNLAPDST
jgi:hypothetical protein